MSFRLALCFLADTALTVGTCGLYHAMRDGETLTGRELRHEREMESAQLLAKTTVALIEANKKRPAEEPRP